MSEVSDRSYYCGQAAEGTPPPAGLGRQVQLQQTQDLARRRKRFWGKMQKTHGAGDPGHETEEQETKINDQETSEQEPQEQQTKE